MPFSGTHYDADTLAILTTAFNSAWEEAQTMNIPTDVNVLRNLLAARIMLAASEGERDPEKLKAAALGELKRPD